MFIPLRNNAELSGETYDLLQRWMVVEPGAESGSEGLRSEQTSSSAVNSDQSALPLLPRRAVAIPFQPALQSSLARIIQDFVGIGEKEDYVERGQTARGEEGWILAEGRDEGRRRARSEGAKLIDCGRD